MKRRLLPIVALVLASCATYHVATDHDAKADFSRLHVYSWAPREKPADPVVENTLVANRIRDAVDRELAAKGFRRAASGPGDFVVDFATAQRQRVDVWSWPAWCHSHCGHSWVGWGHDVQVYDYVQGTLLVGVIDPATNDLLWRGTATSVVDEESGSEKRIDEAVKALLADFPPGAAAAAAAK
jgi:hypothetical protein